jgi:hypothetical protein
VILTDLRRYLQQRGQASLTDIAYHLDAEPDAIKGMLEHWIRKGRVRRHEAGAACSGCSKCDAAKMEVYEWVEQGSMPLRVEGCRR